MYFDDTFWLSVSLCYIAWVVDKFESIWWLFDGPRHAVRVARAAKANTDTAAMC